MAIKNTVKKIIIFFRWGLTFGNTPAALKAQARILHTFNEIVSINETRLFFLIEATGDKRHNRGNSFFCLRPLAHQFNLHPFFSGEHQ